MTRQQLEEGGSAGRRCVLLDVRKLGRESPGDAIADGSAVSDSSSERGQTVVAAFGAERVAVLQWTFPRDPEGKSSSGSFVRLCVFENDNNDTQDVAVESEPSGWVPLWSKEENDAARKCFATKTAADHPEGVDNGKEEEKPEWSLAWSSDGKYLVISGIVVSPKGHREASLWVYASREWMALEDASVSELNVAAGRPPLLIRASLAKYLGTKELSKNSQVVSIFIQNAKSNRLFFVTTNGLLVKMDVQVPKLALLTLNNKEEKVLEADKKALFMMKVVKRMSDWHTGVTAVSFEASSAMLVVSGGLKNPSDELVRGRASSLSVWKMLESEPFCELLDYMMVLSEDHAMMIDSTAVDGEHAVPANVTSSDAIQATAANNSSSSFGLLQSVKGSFFSPLKFMIGGGEANSRVLQGSIRQLAISPNGVHLTMLDNQGRFSIRQIDTCSDFVNWQFVSTMALIGRVSVADMLEQADGASTSVTVKSVSWVAVDLLVFVLENGRVVYGELKNRFDDNEHDATIQSEEEDPARQASTIATALGKVEMVSVQSHVRSFPALLEKDLHIDAIVPISGSADGVKGYQLVTVNGISTVNYFENVELAAFVELLMGSHQYDRALDVVEAHGMTGMINLDTIHRQIWNQFRNLATVETPTETQYSLLSTERTCPENDFSKALHHLSLIQDKKWVVDQCLHAIASDSFAHMKEILGAGLRVLMGVSDAVSDVDQEDLNGTKQQRLLQFNYRLDTLKMLLAEDLLETDETLATFDVDAEDPTRLAEKSYDGAVFAQFRSAPIVEVAKQLACEGRVGSLTVLFQRNAWTIIPRRLEVLSLLPASIAPAAYAHLLPAVGPDSKDEWQFYTLRPQASTQEDFEEDEGLGPETRVVEVEFNAESKNHDLDADDLALFESKARQSDQGRRKEYATWFQERILEMDALFGQLANAFQLSSLAKECFRGWQEAAGESLSQKKTDFESFQQDVERLYNCIYPLQLSSCCLLSLQEWLTLSLHDQILCVVGEWDSVTDAIDHIQAVFVAQRGDALYTLDDAFSALCQTLSKKSSLPALELCAQLIHHSNPSMPIVERWIQKDAQLLRTSIDVVYSATTFEYFASTEDLNARHTTFVEQLWMIFQSLPIRKEDDPPEIEQLQVEVDEMEDLMVTMDVLNKYGVHSSPSELKMQIGEASSTAADDLLQRMCRFSLPGNESNSNISSSNNDADAQQWMEVWRDATKLKTHVFGERISQEAILDVILRHLLNYDVYLDAADHLVTNWVSGNCEVIHHVIVVLIRAIQAKIDNLKGNFVSESDLKTHFAALKCIDITTRVLSFPSLERELDRKKHYERQLRHEKELVHACQLLDLLTYGAAKLSPAAIRPLKDSKDRLDVVLKVFTSNPSHYQPSNRAKEWFRQHNLEQVLHSSATANATPLEAVLYLAKLLRVEDHKHQIVMKGAYAALYCADYDVAYGLTTEVVQSIHVGKNHHRHHNHNDDVELQHLMSLVLDLIAASSFRSWSKKLKLCRLIFSAQNVSSTSMFSHQITNLIVSSMEKLEAVEALATEMGLSEGDVEERRHQNASKRSSVEELLLKELEIVVDLLQEEKNDRGFLLRLLQKGFRLVYIVLTGVITQQTEDNDDNGGSVPDEAILKEETQRAERMMQHMSRICFQEAIAASFESQMELSTFDSVTKCWRTYLEMGCSYLLLWSDFATGEECDLEAFWEQEVLPLLSGALSSGSQEADLLIRQIHHFFMLQVASAVQGDDSDQEVDESAGVALELQERRKQLEVFAGSYEETKRFVVSKNFESEAEGDDELQAEISGSRSKQQVFSNAKRDTFARLAKQCQEKMLSQKKTQELEEMNSFFDENLDLERFSRDPEYRVSKILMLATKKEHYQAVKQFANKYGVDEYQCLLSYIKSVFLPSSASSRSISSVSTLNRHEQLEVAFRSENEDFLEQALEKPFEFGHFLLNNDGDSVYESLDGTDHVGVLLLLRMVLECSKRISQLSSEEMEQKRVSESLFPLSKASIDRITLLFMCLKRLKEVEPVKHGSRHHTEAVDFKLVCAADSCTDLLNPPSSSLSPSNASESRKIAIEAVLPFLNGKTIKILTKILQKLHHVTTSAVVMIYLSDMLRQIWLEQQEQSHTSELSADLAAYAYESCTPFLSVLTNEHVVLFHCLFLGSNWEPVVDVSFENEFYGQSMDGFKHFGALLTTEKRMELISDTLTLFQTRFEAWKVAAHASNGSTDRQNTDALLAAKEKELRFLERELVEATFWFIVDEVKAKQILFPTVVQVNDNIWKYWEAMMRNWFSKEMDVEDDADEKKQQQELFELLVQLCQMVSSVEIASLMAELVLILTSSSKEPVEATLEQVYRRVFSSMVAANLSSDRFESVQRSTVSEWTMLFPDAHSSVREQYKEVASFIDTICPVSGRLENKASRATYQRILTRLDQFPGSGLKQIVESRMTAASVVEPQVNVAHAAMIAEWRHLSDLWDQNQNWMPSAVLACLVLDSGVVQATILEELQMYEREYFGLQTKAIFDLLRSKREFEAVSFVDFDLFFSVPTGLLYERFDSVFKSALGALSASEEQEQSLQSLTVALANLLHFYDSVSTKHKRQSTRHPWEKEQSEALKKRIQAQFSISGNMEESKAKANGSPSNGNAEDNWWSQLLLHGRWSGDRALMKWYLEMGYAKITTPRVIEAFAVAHWEVKKHVCVELILLSPFEKLHAHHRDRLIQSVRDGLVGGRRILELLLLHFDVQVLLQAGLYQNLLELHLNDREEEQHNQQLWTSSGEYLVCALVMMKEYATAARLVCALWHVHPLLWDFENARLTLANYLKSLATAQLPELSMVQDDDEQSAATAEYEEAILRHQVYGRTLNFFQRNMTM